MQKNPRYVSPGRGFLVVGLRIDRLYMSCLGELKEIIVREGFPPERPWRAKRRTIGACEVNEEQISMLRLRDKNCRTDG